MLEHSTIAVPDAVPKLGQSARTVLIDFVVVAEVVDYPEDGTDTNDGYSNANPDLWRRVETCANLPMSRFVALTSGVKGSMKRRAFDSSCGRLNMNV